MEAVEASMRFFCFNPQGFDGGLVRVEVDVRRGLPAIEIVGLAGGAVRESKERVRVALRRAGVEFPLGHVMVNLSPAGLPKAGAAFDLAIALAIANALAEPEADDGHGEAVLAMGELTLSGEVCGVEAIVPALLAARQAGIRRIIVPDQNRAEAAMLVSEGLYLVASLGQALRVLAGTAQGEALGPGNPPTEVNLRPDPVLEQFDTGVFEHQPLLLLGLMAAAAGRHHLMLYGPPGSGKTYALRYLGGLMPELDEAECLEVNRLYSLAGKLTSAQGLVRRAPVRMPHHGSSPEALMGGGKRGLPGEISLAHKGLLILDEAPEFRSSVLQALREPMEEGVIRLGRVNGALWFPADFILGLSLNPCPCGRLGSGKGACACSALDIQRYWGRIGAPVTDRIDIRVPVGMARVAAIPPDDAWGEFPVAIDRRDHEAIRRTIDRCRLRSSGNGALRGRQVEAACRLDAGAARLLRELERGAGLLARSRHGIMRLAKTISELGGGERIDTPAMAAAIRIRAPIEALPGLPVYS
jgi:magnesium chelatase family protein